MGSQGQHKHTPDNATQVVQLRKPSTVGEIATVFSIFVRPGVSRVENDLKKQKAALDSELIRRQSELRDLNMQIEQATTDAAMAIEPWLKQIQEYNPLLRLKPEKLLDHNFTPESLRAVIADLQNRIALRQSKLEQDLAPIKTQKAQCDTLCRGYTAAVGGYSELGDFDLLVTLPDGLKIATLRCKVEAGK